MKAGTFSRVQLLCRGNIPSGGARRVRLCPFFGYGPPLRRGVFCRSGLFADCGLRISLKGDIMGNMEATKEKAEGRDGG